MDFCVFLRDVWQPRKKMPNSDTWTSFWGATSSYEKSQFLMGVYIYINHLNGRTFELREVWMKMSSNCTLIGDL